MHSTRIANYLKSSINLIKIFPWKERLNYLFLRKKLFLALLNGILIVPVLIAPLVSYGTFLVISLPLLVSVLTIKQKYSIIRNWLLSNEVPTEPNSDDEEHQIDKSTSVAGFRETMSINNDKAISICRKLISSYERTKSNLSKTTPDTSIKRQCEIYPFKIKDLTYNCIESLKEALNYRSLIRIILVANSIWIIINMTSKYLIFSFIMLFLAFLILLSKYRTKAQMETLLEKYHLKTASKNTKSDTDSESKLIISGLSDETTLVGYESKSSISENNNLTQETTTENMDQNSELIIVPSETIISSIGGNNSNKTKKTHL